MTRHLHGYAAPKLSGKLAIDQGGFRDVAPNPDSHRRDLSDFGFHGTRARRDALARGRARSCDDGGPGVPAISLRGNFNARPGALRAGNWPRDFKIALVHATESPKCKRVADRNQCTLRVKLDDLILGTQEPDGPTRRARVGWYDSFDIYYSVYAPGAGAASGTFEVKPGDRLVAMLSPAIHPNDQPVSYVGTRLDHASDGVIQSVSATVADILMAGAHAGAKP